MGVGYLRTTPTVEHYRIIQTYRATRSPPYSPALAARASCSGVPSSRPRAPGDWPLDDCIGEPPHRLTGTVAAKEDHGQRILARLQNLTAVIPPMLGPAGALRSRLPSSGSRCNARVDRNANGCRWLGTRQSFRGQPASPGRAILLHASCSHCAWTPHPCSRGPPPTVQYGLQGSNKPPDVLQASGSVVEVEGVPTAPHLRIPAREEHMSSTQYKDTNRTHTSPF